MYLKDMYKTLHDYDLPLYVFSDAMSLVSSAHTTKTITEGRLKVDVAALRESLKRGEIKKFQHIKTQHMLADSLTKFLNPHVLVQVLRNNRFPSPISSLISSTGTAPVYMVSTISDEDIPPAPESSMSIPIDIPDSESEATQIASDASARDTQLPTASKRELEIVDSYQPKKIRIRNGPLDPKADYLQYLNTFSHCDKILMLELHSGKEPTSVIDSFQNGAFESFSPVEIVNHTQESINAEVQVAISLSRAHFSIPSIIKSYKRKDGRENISQGPEHNLLRLLLHETKKGEIVILAVLKHILAKS